MPFAKRKNVFKRDGKLLFKTESKFTKMVKVVLFGTWAVGNFQFFYNLEKI